MYASKLGPISYTIIIWVSGEKKVSAVASSRDDVVETFRQSYLKSGKLTLA